MNVSPFVSAHPRPATEPVLHHDSTFTGKVIAFRARPFPARSTERTSPRLR
jgi:hypothetical protein